MHFSPVYILLACLLVGCHSPTATSDHLVENNFSQGQLFIIGGGQRPPALIQHLIQIARTDTAGYTVILPMSSAEPDTAAFYAARQFMEQGIDSSRIFNFFLTTDQVTMAQLDSLENAQLIYLTGGDQRRFKALIAGSDIQNRIQRAYQRGATIAGTSAGAALMSQKMMTGDEFKHPEYTGDFRTIEAENVELVEGLGLLPQAIIDQHFIYRMRMNRLLTVVLENPEQTGIGIDESTAIIVARDSALVTGIGQVIVLRNPADTVRRQDGLLGGEGLNVSVFLPGDRFALE